VGCDLRHGVKVLLRSGQRRIVLDIARVSKIDAAGVGELVRAYNMARAVNGTVHVENATAWVREVIERVGLGDHLFRDRMTHSRAVNTQPPAASF
jgi:anti-anti-sigma factor